MRRRRSKRENPVHTGSRPKVTILVRLACILAMAFSIGPVSASPQGQLCLDAARKAAVAHDVPMDVLIALAMTETATRRDGVLQPWPWTVNDAGTGHWFDTRDAALGYAYRRVKDGARNFDVGCFQLNFRWHSPAFASLEQMFDPEANADYAARFIRSHYVEAGDWSVAAGRYHSLTEKHASRYRQVFDSHRRNMANSDIEYAAAPASRRAGGGLGALAFPGGHRAAGSLVSLAGEPRPLLVTGTRLF